MTITSLRLRHRLTLMGALCLGAAVLTVPTALGASPLPCPSGGVCLPGTTFESGDGNKTVDWTPVDSTLTERDWGAPGTGVHYLDTQDLKSGSGDDAFGQGAKEDIPNPNIVSGSIPKNKSDLSHFYTAYETRSVGGSDKTFLYIGWERLNTLGNANMDFEFNQNPTKTYANPSVTGTPLRTAGDILVTFDFPGSGTPVLSMFKWVTSANGAASDCYSSNALPCWGKGTLGNLSSAAVTEANAGVSADGLFGEAGINLTDAGAFSSTGCTTFGDGLLKSRSSSAFTSEIKDYVMLAHGSISVSNCGSITIQKKDDSNAAVPGATFALFSDSAHTTPVLADSTTLDAPVGVGDGTITVVDATKLPAGTGFDVVVDSEWMRVTARLNNVLTVDRGVKSDGLTATAPTAHAAAATVQAVKSCTTAGDTLSGTDHVATCTVAGLHYGTYYLVETTTPTGYQTVTGILGVPLTSSNSPVTVTYTDNRAPSTVKVTKVDDASNPLGGAVFYLYTDSDHSGTLDAGEPQTLYTCTTKTAVTATLADPIGTCRITGITTPGDYIVHETSVPSGYDAAADQAITIALGTSYDLATLAGHGFIDPHRYTVVVLVCRESDHSLYKSGVTLAPPTSPPTVNSVTTTLGSSGPTEAQLCGANGLASVTGTSVYPGKHAGNYTATVAVPTAQP